MKIDITLLIITFLCAYIVGRLEKLHKNYNDLRLNLKGRVNIIGSRNPGSKDTQYEVGDTWKNIEADELFIAMVKWVKVEKHDEAE